MFRAPEGRDIHRQTVKKKSELKRLFGFKSEDWCKNKKFLDYGGGTGISYNAALELGFDAYYHDLDRESIAFVADKFGLPSGHLIEHLAGTHEQFDCVFSDNVIEHVLDPENFIKQLYEVVRGGGLLVIKTPHAGDSETWFNPAVSIKEYLVKALKYNTMPVALRAFLKRFWHCDPPRHLYSFSKNSLKVLMKRLGIPEHEYDVSYYPAPFFSNTITEHIFKSHGRFKGVKLKVLRLLALPMIPLEAILQVIAFVLIKLKILSPGGIQIIIKKIH
jgi:2-polyprenyl-3-methyl-5-hydroxy-6-metoxy-1,4-benzoquinol methylase